MIDDPSSNRQLFSLIACAAGAAASMSFRQWEGMSKAKMATAFLVAGSFGYFVSPLVLREVSDQGIAGGVIFLLSAGSNILLPKAVKGLSKGLDKLFPWLSETDQ